MIDAAIRGLAAYAEQTGLIEPEDRPWALNRLLETMRLDALEDCAPLEAPLYRLLDLLAQDAAARSLIEDNITARDLFEHRADGRPDPHAP